jgi:hypothetical protein
MAMFSASLSQAMNDVYYDTQVAAYGPTSCGYGQRLELGYDSYNNPVRFCVDDYSYYSAPPPPPAPVQPDPLNPIMDAPQE